eukprot:scaffold2737_cov99-Cylindrotheca_fusiformis.AAC.2
MVISFLKRNKKNRSILRDEATKQVVFASSHTFDESMSLSFRLKKEPRIEEDCSTAYQSQLDEIISSYGMEVSPETIFRYACFHSFDMSKATDAIETSYDCPYLHLRMQGRLEQQFQSKIIFPLPDLTTKEGKSSVIYMRPSRFVPARMETERLIESLCYVFNDMSDTREKCQNGVTVIANMKGWKIENFSKDSWSLLMQALQGDMVPTRVDMFLIVDPPAWFQKNIWNTSLRQMVSSSFAKSVHIIREEHLSDFLKPGFEQFLPEDLSSGWKRTTELLDDYIDKKRYEDKHLAP